MDDVDALIDDLLSGEETTSDFGRARAYKRCVRFAEEELAENHLCNLFLLRAAERLGQQPMAVPVVQNKVPMPASGRMCVYLSDDEGVVVVGNAAALRYLGRLCRELSKAPLPGENVVLFEGEEPFVGDSYGLTLYHEDEAWFEAAEQGLEDDFVEAWEAEIHGRILSSEEIVAVQLVGPVPSSLALTAHKLYRVQGIDPYRDEPHILRKPFRPETDRVRVLALTDDDGQSLQLAVDLDDPDINYYYDWHLEQIAQG